MQKYLAGGVLVCLLVGSLVVFDLPKQVFGEQRSYELYVHIATKDGEVDPGTRIIVYAKNEDGKLTRSGWTDSEGWFVANFGYKKPRSKIFVRVGFWDCRYRTAYVSIWSVRTTRDKRKIYFASLKYTYGEGPKDPPPGWGKWDDDD